MRPRDSRDVYLLSDEVDSAAMARKLNQSDDRFEAISHTDGHRINAELLAVLNGPRRQIVYFKSQSKKGLTHVEEILE